MALATVLPLLMSLPVLNDWRSLLISSSSVFFRFIFRISKCCGFALGFSGSALYRMHLRCQCGNIVSEELKVPFLLLIPKSYLVCDKLFEFDRLQFKSELDSKLLALVVVSDDDVCVVFGQGCKFSAYPAVSSGKYLYLVLVNASFTLSSRL